MRWNLKSALLLISVGTIALGFSQMGNAFGNYEGPPYQVVSRDGKFEIRKYQTRVVASVEIEDSYERALNKAFGILAGYIFRKEVPQGDLRTVNPVSFNYGENVQKKIPMTAPVVVEPQGKAVTMRFFMPSDYTLDTLPAPQDSRIKLSVLPAQTYLTLRFSGTGRDKDFLVRTQEAMEYARKNNLKVVGEPVSAYYNPPFTPPFLRRNEVHLPISSD